MILNKPHRDDQIQYLRFNQVRLSKVKRDLEEIIQDNKEYMDTNAIDSDLLRPFETLQDGAEELVRILDATLHDAEISSYLTSLELDEKRVQEEEEAHEAKEWRLHCLSFANPM